MQRHSGLENLTVAWGPQLNFASRQLGRRQSFKILLKLVSKIYFETAFKFSKISP